LIAYDEWKAEYRLHLGADETGCLGELFVVRKLIAEKSHFLRLHLVEDGSAHPDGLVLDVCFLGTIPNELRAEFIWLFNPEKNHPTFRGNDFENLIEELLLQLLCTLDGPDGIAHFEKRSEVSFHRGFGELGIRYLFGVEIKSVLATELGRGTEGELGLIHLDLAGAGVGVSLMQQEDENRVCQMDTIAGLEKFFFDRYVVDEGAVVAIQIGELEAVLFSTDDTMLPRDPSLIDVDLIDRVPSDGSLVLERVFIVLTRAAQCDESRIFVGHRLLPG
jgi:hypothetical protein